MICVFRFYFIRELIVHEHFATSQKDLRLLAQKATQTIIL